VNKEEDFINVRKMIASKNPKLLKWLPGFVIRYIERILHQDHINNFIKTHDSTNQQFCNEVLDDIGVKYTIILLEEWTQ
jgi:Acyltransferase